MKTLAILPTYNEAKNIDAILCKLLDFSFLNVLVVDDNSTDKTKEIVSSFFDTGRVHMLERPSKLGLGTAYIKGFQWGLQREYELFFEMDADNSHNPAAVPYFIKKVGEGCDMVVGSRYINNTISVVGWDFKRLLLSKFGNWYASTLLRLTQFTDLTSGYRCYTKRALELIELEGIRSNGYAFQIEMVYKMHKAGLKIAEIPIIFYERNSGSSKMSKKIVKEAVLLPFKLTIDEIKKGLGF
ncbi:MAG: polyprenol monophosphomannose synthase [Nitrospirae bacterium]|nr:polyprenol monophosphomannose synthase [Nitrospirota bacterium]MCL5236528.1 polyprenol monophosphomannose synthase [Nitrospirota bacterium]